MRCYLLIVLEVLGATDTTSYLGCLRKYTRVLEHFLLQVAWVLLGQDSKEVDALRHECVQVLLRRCLPRKQLAL